MLSTEDAPFLPAGIGRRDGGKFPAIRDLFRPMPEIMIFLYL
jgi:hypothetical protein